jgi:hypothetical protein
MTTQASSSNMTNAVAAWPTEAFQKASQSCLSALKHSTEVQAEWQNFINQRLEKDLKFPERLMTCKNPSDFLQTQFNFLNEFIVDYGKEFQRMGEIVMETAQEPSRPAPKAGVA